MLRVLPVLVFFLLYASLNAQNKIDILFTGGIDGYILSENPQQHGDVLRVAAMIDRIVREQAISRERALILDTGDAFSYHYLSKIDSGEAVLQTMRTAGYDAMVVGNLDFKYGKARLKNIANSGLNLLAGNLREGEAIFLTDFLLLKKDGLNIGVVGITDPQIKEMVAAKNFAGLSVAAANVALKNLVEKYRASCDLLIALNHLSMTENLTLARAVNGVDLYLSRPDKKGSDYAQVFANDGTLKSVVVQAPGAALAVGRLEVSMNEDKRMENVHLHPLISTTGVSAEETNNALYAENSRLLDEHLRMRFDGIDGNADLARFNKDAHNSFRDYILYIIQEATRSEIAILNEGFFKFENIATENLVVTPRTISQINWTDNELVTLRLRGKTLKKILSRGRSTFQPNQGGYLHFLAVQNYDASDKRKQQVHSQKIGDNETYAVVTSSFLLSGGNGYSEFRSGTHVRTRFQVKDNYRVSAAPVNGSALNINELIVGYLRDGRHPAENEPIGQWFRKQDILNRPLWLVNLENIDFALQDVQVYNNDQLSAVKDARVNADTENLFGLAARGILELARYTSNSRWTNRLDIENAQTRIGDNSLEETSDDLEFESIFDIYNLSDKLGLPNRMNVFLAGRYDTELTPTENEMGIDNPRQKDLYPRLGINYYGDYVKELRFGIVGKYDLEEKNWDSGIEMNAKFNQKFGRFNWTMTNRLRYLLSNEAPAAGDEEWSNDFYTYLNIPLTENLSIKPQVAYFMYRDKVIEETGRNLKFAISLSYGRSWKPQYLKLFRDARAN